MKILLGAIFFVMLAVFYCFLPEKGERADGHTTVIEPTSDTCNYDELERR